MLMFQIFANGHYTPNYFANGIPENNMNMFYFIFVFLCTNIYIYLLLISDLCIVPCLLYERINVCDTEKINKKNVLCIFQEVEWNFLHEVFPMNIPNYEIFFNIKNIMHRWSFSRNITENSLTKRRPSNVIEDITRNISRADLLKNARCQRGAEMEIIRLVSWNSHLKIPTVSASRCCSMKAENSTSLNLCVAMALPSHGGGGGACKLPTSGEDTAVAGFPVG